MTNYIYPPGQRIELDSSALTMFKSKTIFDAAKNHSFCKIVEVGKFQDSNAEFIVLEIDIERSQTPINPINYHERILIEVKNDSSVPSVYALRENFPLLPHQNLTGFDNPKSLCLYEQSSDEIAIHWTGFSFIERIRQWLSLSAQGNLHQEDQPLEPFLLDSIGTIILPNDINNIEALRISLVSRNDYQFNFIALTEANGNNSEVDYHALHIESIPLLHGVVNKCPKNLLELAQLLSKCSIDFVASLKKMAFKAELYRKKLIILLSIPTKRLQTDEVEKTQWYAFLCFSTIEVIGLGLNVLGKHNGLVSPLISSEITLEKLEGLEVGILKPYFKFNKEEASQLSGVSNDFLITQIGLGAIGSGIFNLLSRSGFGKNWALIDDDVLLPHNLYRHSLLSLQVGEFKADAISFIANHNLGDLGFSCGYAEKFGNLLTPELQKRIEDSDLIIDTSASLAVGRMLSETTKVKARRVSIFLNPKGDSLVILAEDVNRVVNLSELEMLYYKAIKDKESLNSHFKSSGNRVRYGNSCRDISNLISNENFGIFSSIATNIVKNINIETNAFIKLWSVSKEMSVSFHNIPVSDFRRVAINGWNIAINNRLLDRIKEERGRLLPNETGGILIGSFDMNSKTIYVVDSIFSPKDSKQYPNAYYRGIEGVSEKLSQIEELTNGFLTYIGEWHSHPNRSSVQQSSDDLKLFAWITNFMNSIGLPGVMLIAGETETGIYVQ